MQYYIQPQQLYLEAEEPIFALDLQNLMVADNDLGLQNLIFGMGISDDDAHKSFEKLTREQGLQYEEHTVVTEDGY